MLTQGSNGLVTLEMAEMASVAVRNWRGLVRDTKKVSQLYISMIADFGGV